MAARPLRRAEAHLDKSGGGQILRRWRPTPRHAAAGASGNGGGAPPPPPADPERLSTDPAWQRSRFGELERFVAGFLGGGESARLKLQTPLFVADALLGAAGAQLAAELAAAEQARAAVLA